MEKKTQIYIIVSLLLLLISPSFAQKREETVPLDKALFYEVALVHQKYYREGDWLSIVKTSRLLLDQQRKDLALETIVWAQNIIGPRHIINGAKHLESFYNKAKLFDEAAKWKKLYEYWEKKFSNEWKNS
jgi:hypothetical protein